MFSILLSRRRVKFDDLVAKHGHKRKIPVGPGVSLVLRQAPTASIRLGVKPCKRLRIDPDLTVY